MLEDFLAVIGHSWDLDQKRNGTELALISLMEFETKTAEHMMLELAETIHPMFRASSALERWELRSKGRGKKTIHFNGSEQNVELILRRILSAVQLSVYGAVADMCREVSKDTMASGKPEAHDPLESIEIPTELPTADPRTDVQRRRNLLQEYEQQFEQLSDDQKLSKLCSNAGLKTVVRGQYFMTLDAEGPRGMVHLCSEKTLPRHNPRTRARGWIRRITKLGPVLNIHFCLHEDRKSIETQVRSLFQDRPASWVRIVNGVEKYVIETTETIEDEQHGAFGKPIAEARLRMISTITQTPVAVPPRERKWMDVSRGSYDHKCYVISKAMIRILRHYQNIPGDTDGAVTFDDIIEECKKKKRFDGASQ